MIYKFLGFITLCIFDSIKCKLLHNKSCMDYWHDKWTNFMTESITPPKNSKFKYEYIKQYLDFSYLDRYDIKREILQEKIIDSYFANKTKQIKKRIIFTGGCYGAGKSNIMKQLHKMNKINFDDYIYVDQDKMRDLLPEYEQYLREDYYTAGFKTNKETGYLSEVIQHHALSNGYNLIVDGSLRHGLWIRNYIEWIKKVHPEYEIVIVFVTASWERILERNIKRGEITRRVIPLECLSEAFEKSPVSFEMLKSHVHRHYLVNNDCKDSDTDCLIQKIAQLRDINFID